MLVRRFPALSSLITSVLKTTLIMGTICALLGETSLAQQGPATAVADSQASASGTPVASRVVQFTIPEGTRVALLLAHPVESRSLHRGDPLYAQTTAPISVGDQVVIPAGSFVQGPVLKLSRKGDRGEFTMQSLSLSLPDGYVVTVPGPVTIESDYGTASRDPNGAAKGGAIAAFVGGPLIGMAIGLSMKQTDTPQIPPGFPAPPQLPSSSHPSAKAVGIGTAVGVGVGSVTGFALLAKTRHFFVDVSSAMVMTLPQPLIVNHVPVPQAVSGPQTPLPARRPQPVYTNDSDHWPCVPNNDPTRGPITTCP